MIPNKKPLTMCKADEWEIEISYYPVNSVTLETERKGR